MALFITDSSNKIPAIRTAFPQDVTIAIDFPLFGRFTRNSKLKYDEWPKLKPRAKGKIDKLIKTASTHREIFTVLDPTPYGRVLARDVREALRGVNARVSFLFPSVLSPDEIRATRPQELEANPDAGYVVDHYVMQKLTSLLEGPFNVGAEIEVSRQQALVIGALRRLSARHKPFAWVDRIGRVWHASKPELGDLQVGQRRITLSPKPRPIACAPVSWERLWSGLERLQTLGLVTTSECEMSDDVFEQGCEYLQLFNVKPAAVPPKFKYYWVTDLKHDAHMIVDELAARPLFEWLRVETARCCGASSDSFVEVIGRAGAFELKLPITQQWMSLDSSVPPRSSPPYALETPDAIRLDTDLVVLDELFDEADVLSQREFWSAIMWLQRRNYLKRSSFGVYLTSRGIMTCEALNHIMPIALNQELTMLLNEIVQVESDEERVDTINALLSENTTPADMDLWDSFLQGRPLRICSTRSSCWIASLEGEGNEFGIAFADGRMRPVKSGRTLKLGCACGSNIVKVVLDSAYEPVLRCDSCGKEYVLTTLQSME